MHIILSPQIRKACQTLADAGFHAYIVGGAVRDSIMGVEPLDWDITTDALPNQIEELFTETIPTGKEFGTITVLIKDEPIEITTMRQDGPYSDGRHPDDVVFTNNIVLDLGRRDLTVNAVAYDPFDDSFIDPFHGIKHIKRRRLVTVGEPQERFEEDPLRMLRLVRFQSTLGFSVDKKAIRAIRPELMARISAERIQQEMTKLLLGHHLAPALELLYHSGLMEKILPELAAGAGVQQGGRHCFDVLGHSITAAQFIRPQLHLRWAALLHDIGKPVKAGRKHAQIGAELAEDILRRLRYSNQLVAQVKSLIANHMYEVHPYSSDRAMRRFVAKVGPKAALDLVELRRADIAGMYADPKQVIHYVQLMEARIREILDADGALSLKDLDIDGTELMKELHLKPGPLIGQILDYLLNLVLDDPTLNHKSLLLKQARVFLNTLGEILPPKV